LLWQIDNHVVQVLAGALLDQQVRPQRILDVMFPGTAKTSRSRSTASRAVIAEPLC